MILIVVKFRVKPASVESWPVITGPFTAATRAEPGNVFFEWSRSLEEQDTYVLVEGFADDGADAHVGSDHFKAAMLTLAEHISEVPQIINVSGASGWGPMGELRPR